MLILHSQLLDIVRNGGGLIIDLNKQLMLAEQLIELARAAANSGATIIIKNPKFIVPQTMIDIARAGKGKVVFEL